MRSPADTGSLGCSALPTASFPSPAGLATSEACVSPGNMDCSLLAVSPVQWPNQQSLEGGWLLPAKTSLWFKPQDRKTLIFLPSKASSPPNLGVHTSQPRRLGSKWEPLHSLGLALTPRAGLPRPPKSVYEAVSCAAARLWGSKVHPGPCLCLKTQQRLCKYGPESGL